GLEVTGSEMPSPFASSNCEMAEMDCATRENHSRTDMLAASRANGSIHRSRNSERGVRSRFGYKRVMPEITRAAISSLRCSARKSVGETFFKSTKPQVIGPFWTDSNTM